MKINSTNLRGFGFTSSSMYSSPDALCLWWRQLDTRVIFLDGMSCIPVIGIFRLTAEQAKLFKKGQLSLVPPGFCSTSGKAYTEDCEILYTGVIKSRKHLKKLIFSLALT